jgi:hypothetical protein
LQKEEAMNSRPLVFLQSLVAAAALLTASFSGPSPVIGPQATGLYPQYRLTPANPSMQDSISFWIVKVKGGCGSNYVTSFEVKQVSFNLCKRNPCSQDFVITLHSTEYPIMTLTVCRDTSVEYGPRFNFGKLSVGNYTIIDSSDNNRTLMTFSVSETNPALTIKGNVTEDVGTKKILIVVPNAKVYLKQPLYQISNAQSFAPGPIILYNYIDSTTTGNSGAFSFSNIAQGSYTLGFVSDNYQDLDVPLNAAVDTTLSVKLLPLNAYCTVTGTVYEATPPGVIGCAPSPVGCVVGTVAACTVAVPRPIIPPLPRQTSLATMYSFSYKAVTNSQGAYTIDSVPVTYYNRNASVVAKKNGFALETKQALLQPQEAVSVYFALQKAYANMSTKTVDNISFTIATDKAVYNKYEAINVRYTIKNNSMAAVTYTLGGCKYDMVAREPNGDTAYWYLKNYACLAIITYMTLSPGDSTFMNFPAFSYSDTAHSLTITARMNEAAYNQSAISVNVSIVQNMTPALLSNGNNERTQKGPMMTYSRSSKALYLNVDRPQLISVEAYTLSGRKIQEVSRIRFFAIGEHSLSLNDRIPAAGIIIFNAKGQGLNETLRVNIAGCR